MLMTKERRSAIRTLRGWAISVLQDASAIHECEEHGWMQDPARPRARLPPRPPVSLWSRVTWVAPRFWS
jgi:hypothetical protein